MKPCQECLAEVLNELVVLGLLNLEVVKKLRHLEQKILAKAKERDEKEKEGTDG